MHAIKFTQPECPEHIATPIVALLVQGGLITELEAQQNGTLAQISSLCRSRLAVGLNMCDENSFDAARAAWVAKGGLMLPDEAWDDDATVRVQFSGKDIKTLAKFFKQVSRG